MTENQIHFATVGQVFEDGVSLIFDGQEAATEKHYRVNTSIVFHSGDRVKILADSGTYVVEYVVGVPKTAEAEQPSGLVPPGGSYGQVLQKSSNNDYDMEWASSAGIPRGGSAGTVLRKKNATDFNVEWGDIPAPASVQNQYNTNDAYAIQFRTSQTYGTPDFYIRFGTRGTWRKMTLV